MDPVRDTPTHLSGSGHNSSKSGGMHWISNIFRYLKWIVALGRTFCWLGLMLVLYPVHVALLIKFRRFGITRWQLAERSNLIYLRSLEVFGRIPENTATLEFSDWLI